MTKRIFHDRTIIRQQAGHFRSACICASASFTLVEVGKLSLPDDW